MASGSPPSLSATKRRLAKTWAANTRQALERVARNQKIRDRDQELQRQNDRLSRLDRVNRLIRSISPAVVSADTRAAVEDEVCQRLLRLEAVTGAWFANVDLATGSTFQRASAGAVDDYLSDVPDAAADTATVQASPPVPARQAYEAGESLLVSDLFDIEPGPWWRDRALTQGTHSIVAIPISNESTKYGAIEIHIDRPQGITDEEIAALEALGDIAGHAIWSIQQRSALLAGGSVTLKFHVASDSGLSRLAAVANAPLTITDVDTGDEGTCSVFVTVDTGHTTDEAELTSRISSETGASVLRSDSTGIRCVLTLGADSSVQSLVRQGGALKQIDVSDSSGRLTVTVAIPYSMDVREYADTVTDATDSITLIAKYEPESTPESRFELAASVDDHLTDRQRETLRMAFYAGYFDWPRHADAETVAQKLGISQPTFSQHLRAAEQKVLEALYD